MMNVSAPMLTPDLVEFIQNRVCSFVRWDLLRYFHDSPTRKETAEAIAKATGRDAIAIEDELDGLVEAKILAHEDKEDVRRYKLVKEKATRQLLTDFIAACYDRNFRMEAIQVVINSMSFSPR